MHVLYWEKEIVYSRKLVKIRKNDDFGLIRLLDASAASDAVPLCREGNQAPQDGINASSAGLR